MGINLDKILEQYGLLGVLILLIPYFVKSISPAIHDLFNFLFSFRKMTTAQREKALSDFRTRDAVAAQAELQQEKSRFEHDQWMYKNTLSVLQENLAWIKQQFTTVQKNEESALIELRQELLIISGQIKMLTHATQQIQTHLVSSYGMSSDAMDSWGVKGGE